jgi:hypothetical protein
VGGVVIGLCGRLTATLSGDNCPSYSSVAKSPLTFWPFTPCGRANQAYEPDGQLLPANAAVYRNIAGRRRRCKHALRNIAQCYWPFTPRGWANQAYEPDGQWLPASAPCAATLPCDMCPSLAPWHVAD